MSNPCRIFKRSLALRSILAVFPCGFAALGASQTASHVDMAQIRSSAFSHRLNVEAITDDQVASAKPATSIQETKSVTARISEPHLAAVNKAVDHRTMDWAVSDDQNRTVVAAPSPHELLPHQLLAGVRETAARVLSESDAQSTEDANKPANSAEKNLAEALPRPLIAKASETNIIHQSPSQANAPVVTNFEDDAGRQMIARDQSIPVSSMYGPKYLVRQYLGDLVAEDLFQGKSASQNSADAITWEGAKTCAAQAPTDAPVSRPDQKQTAPMPVQTPSQGFPASSPAPAAAPTQTAAQPTTDAQGNTLVSNTYSDSDLKGALSDLASAAGVTISPDESVSGNITASFKNISVEKALDILTMAGGYTWKMVAPSVYLVGKADPTNPNFFRFAETRIYHPNYETADYIASLLPAGEAAYVKTATGERTITITAGPSMMERIFHDVWLIDQPRTKVELEALVTQIDETKGNVFNFSWNWKYFGISTDGQSANTLSYAQVSSEDVATIKAAINDGKAELRASPRVLALDGEQAQFEVAQQQYFEALSSGNTALAYSQIQEIKTGITLKVTPYVSEDGEITMVLDPEVSDVSGTTSSGLPITTVRSAQTTVRVKNGETLVIGGMQYINNVNTDTRIPILGYIPIIGNLFHYYDHEKQKTEVVIMITPRIVRDGS